MADPNYIGDNRPDGMVIGASSTEKVGFYGVTPVAQHATIADLATTTVTTASTTTSPAGYATTTQADDIAAIVADMVSKFNTLLSDLEDSGLHATS